MMLSPLGGNEELAAKLTPTWEVGCRRATPGPGYLEAFTQPHVSLTTSTVTHVTLPGILTSDGAHHAVEAIVCATGFDVSHRPPFPIIGLDHTDLRGYWNDEPLGYLSAACLHFPNLFFYSDSNTPVDHGSLIAAPSRTTRFVSLWLRKVASKDILFVVLTPEATKEFNAYGEEIMERYVWTGGCRGWYKKTRVDGRVTAMWQGSALGFKDVIGGLRPGGFRVVWRTGNRWRWMGDGRARVEREEGADLAWYLKK